MRHCCPAGAARGRIHDKTGLVACGRDGIRIETVQPEGKKPMDFTAAINGGYIAVGDVFD